MVKKISSFILILTLMILVAACGSGNSNTSRDSNTTNNELASDKESMVELAKKEGKVVFYGAMSPDQLAPAFKIFEDRYGISVEYIYLRGGEMVERLQTEQRAGQYNVDLVNNGPTPMWVFKNEGYFEPFVPEGAENVIGNDPDGYFLGTSLIAYGFLVNTEVVPEDKIPTSWHDLLDPYWKGKIYSDDPRTSGGGNSIYTILLDHEEYGEDFLRKLAEQDVVFTRQQDQFEDAVGRGETPIFIPARSQVLSRLQGAPVKWIGPEDFTPYLQIPTGVMKEAPHPNAARLLAEFLISREAQEAIGQHVVPALEGVAPPLPEMSLEGKNLITQTEEQLANQADYTQRLTEIFK